MGTLESFLKNRTSLTLSVATGGVMLQGRETELPCTEARWGTEGVEAAKKKTENEMIDIC